MDQKYRGIKTTNNTIKSKLMTLKGVDKLLGLLGFVRESEEIFVLQDNRIGEFFEGEPAIDYRKRLAAALLGS